MKQVTFAIGDRVAYSARFLRSLGRYTGNMPHLRGTIEQLIKWPIMRYPLG